MKSGIPNIDYVINPYTGCAHGCLYCYARFMKRFTNHREPWGSFVDVKINAPEKLELLLQRKKKWHFTALLSSVTDAYQPLEKKYQVTKRIIEIFDNHNHNSFNLDILTRSSLILRDLELLVSIDQEPSPVVTTGMSISMIDDNWRRMIEPRASSIEKRISAIKEIHDAGIHTYLFFGPFIPGISSWEVLDAVVDVVDHVTFDRLNPRGAIDRLLLKKLQEKDSAPEIYRNWVKANPVERNDYLKEMTAEFTVKVKELGIKNYHIVYETEWDKKRPV